MKFKTGDRVKFLNDVGSGVIVSFPDARTALVMNEDGFEIPVLLTELIPAGGFQAGPDPEDEEKTEAPAGVSPEEEKPLQDARVIVEKDLEVKPIPTPREVIGDDQFPPVMVLAWVLSKKRDSFSLYLVNDSPLSNLYTVHSLADGGYELIRAGRLEADTQVRLLKCSRRDFENFEEIRVQALVFEPAALTPVSPPLVATWTRGNRKMAPEVMFRENPYFGESAWMVPLSEPAAPAMQRSMPLEEWKQAMEKDAPPATQPKAGKPTQEEKTSRDEVDLHLEAIVDDPENISPAEALEIQKARFITALEGGLRSGIRKMIFIHGVGDGKLKYEIRRIIDRQYPRLRYQDASFREYGYGATLVIFP